MCRLTIALQAGAMKSAMKQLFADASVPIVQGSGESFDGWIGHDIRVRFMKSSTIPEEVFNGDYDCGITGQDVIAQAKLQHVFSEIVELPLGRRSDHPIEIVLVGQRGATFGGADLITVYIDQEYSMFASELFTIALAGTKIKTIRMEGTAEEKVRGPHEFAIIATETGASLRANDLEVVHVFMKSQMVLFVGKGLKSQKRAAYQCVEELSWLLKGVSDARGRILLKMNVVLKEHLPSVLRLLPSLASPTVMPLNDSKGFAVEAVVPTGSLKDLIPVLKRAGAGGILQLKMHSVVL